MPQIHHVRAHGGLLIRIVGDIDETFERAQMVEGASGVVVVDLDGVKRITSYGVREWTTALAELTQDYTCFVNCRPSLVAQFNMIDNFAGPGQLLSLYLPYICTTCRAYTEILADLQESYELLSSYAVPEVKCLQCGA